MSFACRGLSRSERLLPLESTEVLDSTHSFLLHVLHRHHDGDGEAGDAQWRSRRLREHVLLYWDQQQAYRMYQRKLLHEVRSTRGPVRFAGFPQVGTAPKHTDGTVRAAHASALDPAECRGGGVSANGNTFPTSEPGTEDVAAASSSPPEALEGTLPPPRSLAAWNWISLVAPYERLLCPSLLYSALLSPSIGGCTSVYYGAQQPLLAPDTDSTPAPAGCVRARWSTHTCQSLWALHSFAASASIPAQEVYVMCAGTIMYLDAIMTAGRVWSELEGLWGNDLLAELDRENAKALSGSPDTSETETCLRLSSLKSFLSQPPQTYAAMLQHVRLLLEALTSTTTASSNASAPAALEATGTALPRPLVPWVEAAMRKEVWTSITDIWTTSSNGSDSDASSIAVQTLRHAVAQWLLRRGATVTATTPTGSRAAPLPPRDLCMPRGLNSGVPASPKLPMRSEFSACAGSPAPRVGTRRHSINTAKPSGAAAAAVSITFEPFEPHDTPRDQHPFSLPPLPQDPVLIAFTVVWRRTLRRCVLDPDMLRQRLRQVILGYSGQRCEELLCEARQQQRQWRQSVDSFAVAGPPEGPLSTTASTVHQEIMCRNNAAADSALGAAVLSTSLSFSAPVASSSLPLLTHDPAATSFRVLGPRWGEWLTSSRGGGGWSGFRGELFCCVGPPPLPLTVAPLLSGTQTARARCRPPPSSATSFCAAASAPSAEQLTEMFVDGALDLDGAGGVSSSSAVPALNFPPLLYSAEELADRLCRLGSALPRYATEVYGDRLPSVDANFVCEVLQRHCLPLLLACQRRGIQQWGLRGWMKGIALTLLDKSGAESRVITPVKLVELGLQQARSAGGQKAFSTATTLRMVMDGGLNEALAFLEHVQKRPERTVRRLPVRRLVSDSDGIGSSGAPLPAPALSCIVTTVGALLLRRAEESALFRIFQSHPSAALLAGCGVQRLALPSTTTVQERRHVGGGAHPAPPQGSSTLLLVRTCGIAVDWDLQDCYERPRFSRLREPRRLVSYPHREGTASGGTQWLPLPPELGKSVERVTLPHMRRMLQYYLRSLDTTPAPCEAGCTVSDASLATGVKRSRPDSEEEGIERLNEPLLNANGGPAEPSMDAAPSAVVPPADMSGTSVARMPRTTLFPIDRAAVLYVLRHHPQYYRQVKGCGIKQVYVGAATMPPEESVAVVAHTNRMSDSANTLASAAAASASPSSSDALVSHRPRVIVERVCGQSVEVDVEACYDKVRDGRPLRPFMMLV